MNIVNIFPTKVAIIDDVLCSSEVSSYLQNNQHEIITIISDNEYRLTQNKYVLNNPFLHSLSDVIMNHVKAYAKDHLSLKYDDYMFSQSWVTYCEPGKQRHYRHIHTNSLISGVYYFQDHENSSPIVMNREENIYQKHVFGDFREEELYTIDYRKNRLIIFPSEQSHYVPANSTDIIRKSLVFNILPRGVFGDPYGEIDISNLK